MKSISRRICGVLVGLGVLGLIVPVVRADEMADWMAEMRRQNEEFNRKAQEDREAADRAYREAQESREARERWDQQVQRQREAQDRAYAEREAMDKYWRDVQAARDERAAWYKWNEDQRQWYENERRQKEWDDWMNNLWGHWPLGDPTTTAPQALAFRSAAVVILNPFALEKMAPQDQKRVRQEATQMGLPILQQPPASQQIIHNPFVRSPK